MVLFGFRKGLVFGLNLGYYSGLKRVSIRAKNGVLFGLRKGSVFGQVFLPIFGQTSLAAFG